MVTIDDLRYSVGMLELCVKMLKRQIEDFAGAAEAAEDDKIRCPQCGFELSEQYKYNTMGANAQQYACPNCPFRGEVVGG